MSASLHVRVIRRGIAASLTMTLAAAGLATPGFAASSAGFCRVSVPVTISPADHEHPALRVAISQPGSASCTGSLGPWLMGGRTGWSTLSGQLNTAVGRRGKARASVIGGHVHLWATVPRFAWFDASMVSFVSAFRLRRVRGRLLLAGTGRLLPTPKSPLAASFGIAGVAALIPANSGAGAQGKARLVLRFGVRSGDPTAQETP